MLEPGELAFGGKLIIGPGGKARNMAQMAAVYLGPGKVAMIGRTSRDPYGLWKAPIQALMKAAVDTTYVRELSFEEAGGKFPGIALIPVDKVGQNQIYVLPGVNEDFSVADIDAADQLFHNTSGDKIVLLALEIPMETALYAADKARLENIRVILDPGGISGPIAEKILRGLFLIKPNEHETKLLTGIAVEGFESAKIAASNLLAKGVQHVLITHGSRGAYLFGEKLAEHIPVPDILPTGETDETGCGD
ncbi:MAG: bifunctional hydroxymethylpyrimidine kinase/phosphomethylpyrimidine kinase, partial [Candidatus Marinimicrobia bacterium]|nr:bifunctional hydroxymethylpyrimidine kinase/phosphomethylpyrimidine kinase [Candidatus Neomarinimicrobiota bacterium]